MDKNLYALKGGCNLRFFWKSIRYSEDIDFDVRTIGRETLRKNVNHILNAPGFRQILRSSKLEITQRTEPKQTDTTQRWKVHLLIEGTSTDLPTKIEFSRRQFEEDLSFGPIDSEVARLHSLRPILASHYGWTAAFTQKVVALALRTQTQARDIFDLALLYDQKDPAAEIDIDTKILTSACENIAGISFEQFKSQVVAYLMPEYQDHYGSRRTWDELQERVMNIVESL
ncbi:MAG: Nucleotidyl transferase AbiEii toxin, Type system [Verrucomicrobiota bacterium]